MSSPFSPPRRTADPHPHLLVHRAVAISTDLLEMNAYNLQHLSFFHAKISYAQSLPISTLHSFP
ncbi:hypothetical protein MPNT_330012 [Candidatus Methylacidithermus pantelleriae]|uniref:Uncharacterized protein n=1 Tax=Candidatus Methylacidithermus pantelleriae TaxID=2744239 RepID=A0A8J2BQW0_9BACT|nr:hypothetical protein MPNT_330012 [Candidatus Methylacidithermus pantelleriae]